MPHIGPSGRPNEGFWTVLARLDPKSQKNRYFSGFFPTQSFFRALVLKHHQVDGLHGGSVGLHYNLDLDPGLAKLGF